MPGSVLAIYRIYSVTFQANLKGKEWEKQGKTFIFIFLDTEQLYLQLISTVTETACKYVFELLSDMTRKFDIRMWLLYIFNVKLK